MSLPSGTRLGPYEILAPLGAGGMGEVYRAKDPRLGREVAIKVLPATFSADGDRLRRFEQEAKAAGVLNHPNITAVYDIGSHDGAPYVVQELLEGETLRAELAAGRFSPRKAIEHALQIAQGLAAAHDKGIVHRDLKPENVFVTRDGRVKILDFGLAKLTEVERGGAATNLPTAAASTEPGVVMGTLGYMSPEQVKGKPADARSDIFAFGAVFYEMLSGKRAFRGESAGETMASILKEDPPDLSLTSQNISAGLERIVRHCLEKNPERRFQSASDIGFALQTLSESSGSVLAGTLAPRARRIPGAFVWGVAGLLAGAAAATLFPIGRRSLSVSARGPIRFEVAAPPDQRVVGTLALSPDGSRLAFIARGPGGSQRLWIRPLGNPRSEMLADTEGAELPFWSPDGRFVGFFAGGELKRIAVSGGPPQSIAPVTTDVRGASWGADDRIVFTPTYVGPLMQVSASGGKVTPATTLDKARNEGTHRWPWFLPDGRHFLYYAATSTGEEPGEIFAGKLGSNDVKHVVQSSSLAVYTSPGYLVFVRGSTLVAQAFDAERLEVQGDVIPLGVDLPSNSSTSGRRALSASLDGTLSWSAQASSASQPVLLDRQGREIGRLAEASTWYVVRLSPDGQRLALARSTANSTVEDIWTIDVARNISTRLTLDPADETSPIWSPDGTRLALASDRQGASGNLYIMRSDQPGSEKLVFANDGAKTPDSWAPDGRSLIFEFSTPQSRQDLWLLPLDGDRKPVPFLATPFSERNARFSPDGRHVAYESDISGAPEIYVRPFHDSGGTWRVSNRGGQTPAWRGDGREIYYLAPDGALMATPVTSAEPFQTGTPAALFKLVVAESTDPQYDVFPDGKRFLVNQQVSSKEEPINVLVNWIAALKKP
ncbi:MAG: protein kinase domain-containing protein [Acidobacteriota bacterium]